MLFSALALPDIEVTVNKTGKDMGEVVTLKGMALFDRKRGATESRADCGYGVRLDPLPLQGLRWCFVECDFKKAPNLKAALKVEVDPEEFKLLISQPFPVLGYTRISVKALDVDSNRSTAVLAVPS